ncbi:MAG: lipid A biosynthesis acyltransferase [Pelagibacteraceae bacterium]|jgi:KDO2-lipid IV(A) lauroyltransferase|nr:lipid A biosynthesis acyltransferase [Pelagibacteraceae bacterium]|tara:strand:- start:206 stop:1066 length:861 start_codon:yes stop_codon:yes gene_type:complete
MKIIKYFIEFLFIVILFIIFKLLGLKLASKFGSFIGGLLGPFFRSKEKIILNIKKALPDIGEKNIDIISKKMWKNYGRILSEYIYIKKFRNSKNKKTISVEGQEILDEIKNTKEPVVFISGHFNNFELMAMQIEKSGINLAAIYRPLNNIFLNKIMERLRIKYICKKQIKKGRSGTRDLVESFKKKYSIALMIDQRVSEGIKCSLFGQPALTTTIPAQLFKKFGCKIVPVYIERINDIFFKITVSKPIIYSKETSIEEITLDLNKWLERKILNNPTQWIWSHDRWK